MIFIALLVLLILFVAGYIVKKECFESNTYKKKGNKYSIGEITRATDVFFSNLKEPHYLVKINSVDRNGAFIVFNLLAYNQKRSKVNNFYAKVRIPLSKTGKYTLVDSYVSDSNEVIQNGVHSIRNSQTYGKVI
tara:strand:+ start:4422 stop:4823 length:402 start_codon:yes stop_codon:yes gene_type:complete